MHNLSEGLPQDLPFVAYPALQLGLATGMLMPAVVLDRRFTLTTLADEIAGEDILCAYLAGREDWALVDDGKPDFATPPFGARKKGWRLTLTRDQVTIGRPGCQLVDTPFGAPEEWWAAVEKLPLVVVMISDTKLNLPPHPDAVAKAVQEMTGVIAVFSATAG